MKISIDTALRNGWNRMMTILFRPFDILKWLVIGFASFLASLGRGKSLNFNFPSGQDFGGGDAAGGAQALESWFFANMVPIILVGLGVLLVLFALALLIVWLSSRGRFIFLHDIVNNEPAIKAPWVKYGHLGDKIFLFRLLFGLCVFFLLALVLGVGILFSFPYIKAGAFSAGLLGIIIPLVLLFVAIVLCALVVKLVLMDFVVPVMFKRDIGVVPGFRVFLSEFLKGHFGQFFIFYLVKIGLGIAASVIVVLGTCFTCCIAALPYISSVFFLPIAAFIECYTLSFIAQFGDEWNLFTWKLEGECCQPPARETLAAAETPAAEAGEEKPSGTEAPHDPQTSADPGPPPDREE